MGIGQGRNPEETKKSNKKSERIDAIFHPKKEIGK
jgi:hypothetical protein